MVKGDCATMKEDAAFSPGEAAAGKMSAGEVLPEELFAGDLFEGQELKTLQERVCETAGVFICCMDYRGTQVTEMSGNREEAEKIKEYIGRRRMEAIVLRMSESSLEEQAVENTDIPNLRLAAVSVKHKGRTVLNWLVCGVISDIVWDGCGKEPVTDVGTQVTEEQFEKVLDFLREISGFLVRCRLDAAMAEAESRRSRYSAKEMSAALRRNEAVTEVVQLLDSDAAIEEIMENVLSIQGGYLGISSAGLFRVRREDGLMELSAKWLAPGVKGWTESREPHPVFGFLRQDKPVVLSTESVGDSPAREEIRRMGIKAVVAMPLSLNGKVDMYACYFEKAAPRTWQVEDIRFLNDTVKILQGIITKRIQKNSLAGSYASLESILDNVGSAIYVRDAGNGRILFANKVLQGKFAAELAGGKLGELFELSIPEETEKGSFEVYYGEREQWYDLHYTHIKWVDGRPVGLYAVYDITEKKLYQKKIEQQAYTDFLTGMYNRMCCERDLARHVEAAKRQGKNGALLYLDLDDFKHINDGLGHQYGDVLLKAISHSLQRVSGIKNSCYRMGGDEFVIIIPPEHYPAFEGIMNEIREIFSKPWFLKDADYYCTMSMGVVEFPKEGESVSDLIKKADIAMYEAKKCGKNRIARYSDDINSASGRRLDMEKNMRDATAAGYREFEIYYQPIIDIQEDGMPCTGAEALIRWNSAELGFIPPAEFIPLAEYLGLINPIGNYVLREACRHCKKWNDSGYPGYKVNVNLSVVQLLQPDIVEVVAATLKETQLSPRNLTLEVTESLAINDMDRMKEILGSIKSLGVRIALDDFGTGYSSLNHIREIPFDVIKVDQSFVKDLAEDAYSQSFIRMVAELADAINVDICVEGIETKEQYKVLEGMKVRLIQGYYFDKPMKREDFETKYIKPVTRRRRSRKQQ